MLTLKAKLSSCSFLCKHVGLWYGPSKPPMKMLLEPVLESLRELSISGVVVRTPTGLKTFRAMLVMGQFDLPAKAAVLCAKQYNGEHGCAVCGCASGMGHVYTSHSHTWTAHMRV